jgi:hypothetical protein
MQDRTGLRGNFEFPVVERDGGFSFWCTALNVSPTGILIERGDQVERRRGSLVELELHLPDVPSPVRVLATFVWSNGTQLGLKFVGMNDADRLTLAEALDALTQRGGSLN